MKKLSFLERIENLKLACESRLHPIENLLIHRDDWGAYLELRENDPEHWACTMPVKIIGVSEKHMKWLLSGYLTLETLAA